MPKIDVAGLPTTTGTTYPAPFDEPCRGRESVRLGVAAGLTQFGVNRIKLPPGAWSSQRHWHAKEDEFIYVIDGEVTLIDDDGSVVLRQGDAAGFQAGVRVGHHLVNRSDRDAVFLVVGSRDDDDYGEYSDIDLQFGPGRYSGKGGGYTRKDGTPY
jgi:uncharacterized cupin superfamily protein